MLHAEGSQSNCVLCLALSVSRAYFIIPLPIRTTTIITMSCIRNDPDLNSCSHCRQFKEQQRLARQDHPPTNYRDQKLSSQDSGPASLSSAPTSAASRLSQYSSSSSSSRLKAASELRTVQKEAVMSYMDRVRPGAAGAPPEIAPPPPPP